MRRFAALMEELDATAKPKAKVAALARYFSYASDPDKLWTIALLIGKRPKRSVGTLQLRAWVTELGIIPPWLFDECYRTVGDLAETVALLIPPAHNLQDHPLTATMEQMVGLLRVTDDQKKEFVKRLWLSTNTEERFVINKLVTGGFRIEVSLRTIVMAVGQVYGLEPERLTHRLLANWDTSNTTFEQLMLASNLADEPSIPYESMLAAPLDELITLGDLSYWQAEWKWDGVRAQLIKRDGYFFVWGKELMTHQVPEFAKLDIPDGTVLDGEIVGFRAGQPLKFLALNSRLQRKNNSAQQLADCPVHFIAFDLLELAGKDIRHLPLTERRAKLEEVIISIMQSADDLPPISLSDTLNITTPEQLMDLRQRTRDHVADGIIFKRKDSLYFGSDQHISPDISPNINLGKSTDISPDISPDHTHNSQHNWYSWSLEPYYIDAVLLYAQRGTTKRLNVYQELTFAVWDGEALVPFAKASDGLTDAEMREIFNFVRKNTIERFGPVRSLTPSLVFEIAFESVSPSTRHKSGLIVKAARIVSWKRDLQPHEANTLAMLKGILITTAGSGAKNQTPYDEV